MIDARLAIGAVAGLLVLWLIYRLHRQDTKLPQPDLKACRRGQTEAVTN